MADAGKTPVSLDNLRRFREKSAYGEATPGAAGLMSAADKAKLDGLAEYELPATTADKLGGMKPGTGLTAASDGTVSLAYGTDEEFLAYVLGESSTASEVG